MTSPAELPSSFTYRGHHYRRKRLVKKKFKQYGYVVGLDYADPYGVTTFFTTFSNQESTTYIDVKAVLEYMESLGLFPLESHRTLTVKDYLEEHGIVLKGPWCSNLGMA